EARPDHRQAGRRERPALHQDAVQVGAVDEVGDAVEGVLLLDEVVDRHHRLVAQLGVGPPLAAEPLRQLPGAGQLGVEGLHGDAAVEPFLEGLEDDAHAAAPELADDPAGAHLANRHGTASLRRGRPARQAVAGEETPTATSIPTSTPTSTPNATSTASR